MIARTLKRLVLRVGLCSLAATATLAQGATQEAPGTVWTAIIPDAFPDDVFTWHMTPDGRYREDGRDASTGRPIQPTLSGRWSREGARMILRQDDLPYLFDGVVLGNLYGGTLYFAGRAASRFCAAKGEQPPAHCDSGAGVAAVVPEWRSPSLNRAVPKGDAAQRS